MSRPRRTDRNLPPCVYRRHGAYYYVRGGTWHHLGRDLSTALSEYARLAAPRDGSCAALIEQAIAEASKRVQPSTLAAYRRAGEKCKAALRDFRIEQVRQTHVAQLLDHYGATASAATNHMRSVLKLAFDLAVSRGLCDANPVTAIPRRPTAKRTRYLSDAEYCAIWTAAPPQLRCIMDLCYLTAERIGDVLALRESDITAEGIQVDQRKTGKRLLHLWTPDLRAAIEAARALHGAHRRLLLLAQRNGRPRGYRGVRDLWARACARAGIADAHLHDLRAKSLTDAKRQGLDPKSLAGHSTEQTTIRYLRGLERDAVIGPSFGQLAARLDTGGKK